MKIIGSAIEIASEGMKGIHLSFDLDALDPTQAPGVGTPVYNGLTQGDWLQSMLYKQIHCWIREI